MHDFFVQVYVRPECCPICKRGGYILWGRVGLFREVFFAMGVRHFRLSVIIGEMSLMVLVASCRCHRLVRICHVSFALL